MYSDDKEVTDKGFTLIELIIAIVLVGILAAVAIVGLTGITGTGNKSACSTMLASAKAAAATYYANTGAYPKTSGPPPFGFELLAGTSSSTTTVSTGTPLVLSLPSGVSVSGNVMSSTSGWSITMIDGGGSSPNGYKDARGDAPCP